MPLKWAYATLLWGNTPSIVHQVICLQTTLANLSALPLLVVHNDDATLSPEFALIKAHRRVPFVPFVMRPRQHGRALMHAGQQLVMMQKFQLFNMSEYDRIVYMDADILVRTSPDALFLVPVPATSIGAVRVGKCFNAGLLVIRPSTASFAHIVKTARANVWHAPLCEYYRTDQTALNLAFPQFAEVDRKWNNCQHVTRHRISVPSDHNVHFVGETKPRDMCTAEALLHKK